MTRSDDRERFVTLDEIDAAVASIRKVSSRSPRIGLILGSGLGDLAEEVAGGSWIETSNIPGWPAASVEGHRGRIVLGTLEQQDVLVLQGRAHFYEGHPIDRIGLQIRVMQRMGIEMLLVTNAAGAVNPAYAPGDLMLIVDHVNLLGMAGVSPLRGPNLDVFGPRFPDMSQAYDRELAEIARQAAREAGVSLHEGVYICLAGPSFEGPADLRFLRGIGVDAVGMSTVPEVIVARQGGTRVLGISGISNKANLDGRTVTTHEEVLRAGKVILPKLTAVIKGVLRRL